MHLFIIIYRNMSKENNNKRKYDVQVLCLRVLDF